MSEQNFDLKKTGLKATLPRIRILEVLDATRDEEAHLSAEDIYRVLIEQNEDVGVATIYRVLSQFEESGIVQKLNFENNQAVYELCGLEHHDHLVCVKCSKIIEFQDDVIEQHQLQIAKKHGFELTDHSLYIMAYARTVIKFFLRLYKLWMILFIGR